ASRPTSIELDRTALLAPNRPPPLGRLHSDVSRMADVSTGAPIARSVVVDCARGLAAAVAVNHAEPQTEFVKTNDAAAMTWRLSQEKIGSRLAARRAPNHDARRQLPLEGTSSPGPVGSTTCRLRRRQRAPQGAQGASAGRHRVPLRGIPELADPVESRTATPQNWCDFSHHS